MFPACPHIFRPNLDGWFDVFSNNWYPIIILFHQSEIINISLSFCVLNSINPLLQFTMEYSKGVIPFLDILIHCSNDKIWMDIYYKPNDSHRCLLFSSDHPNHCKRNLPFTLTRRIFHIDTSYLSHWYVVSAQLLETLK